MKLGVYLLRAKHFGPRGVARRTLAGLEAWVGVERIDRLRNGIDLVERRLRGTPWLDDEHFELRHGTWGGVLRIFDDSGRLLGENHGLAFGAKTHPSIVMRPSNFKGSRYGKPYNVEALRQMAADWSKIRALIASVRARFLVALGEEERSLTLIELYAVARIVTAYPAYLLRRRPGGLGDGEIPGIVAAAFKVMAGVHSSLEHMIERDAAGGFALDRRLTPEGLYDYIEAHGLFLSGEGRACGGPERLVREILAVSIDGPRAIPTGSEESTTGVDPAELDALVRYGRPIAALKLLLVLARGLAGDDWTTPARRNTLERFGRMAAMLSGVPGIADRLAGLASKDRHQRRAALVAAMDQLSRTANDDLGRPAVRASLTWATIESRFADRLSGP